LAMLLNKSLAVQFTSFDFRGVLLGFGRSQRRTFPEFTRNLY
jgi:hypothetical protein